MKIAISQLRRLIAEAIDSVPPEAEAALPAVLAQHPNREAHELWWGDNDKLIVDVPDDDSRSVERYEWTGDRWVYWDSEPYYE